MNTVARGLLPHRLVVLLSVVGAGSLRGQDPRDAMVARAFNEFDAARRVQLLMSALNPTAGPPRGAWPVGVQLLAQTLIEDGQDSVAGVWLRWAVRLSPDLQPDTVQFLPKVVVAYRSARDFVLSTRAPGDSTAATTWLWPAQEDGRARGTDPSGGYRHGGSRAGRCEGRRPNWRWRQRAPEPGELPDQRRCGRLRQRAGDARGAAGRDDGARVPPPLGARAGGADQAGGAREDHAGARCRAAAEEEGIPGGMGGARGRGRSRARSDPRWWWGWRRRNHGRHDRHVSELMLEQDVW